MALFFTGRSSFVSVPSLLMMKAAWSWQSPYNISPCLSFSKSMWGINLCLPGSASLTIPHKRLTVKKRNETYSTCTSCQQTTFPLTAEQ